MSAESTFRNDDRDVVLDALARLAPSRADDREAWIKVGMALHSLDDSLCEVWVEWSRQSEKFNIKACHAAWKSFGRTGGITVGTLFQMAKIDSPGWHPEGGLASPLRKLGAPTKIPETPRERPPQHEIMEVWSSSAEVADDPVAFDYLREKRSIDPFTVTDRELARVIPQGQRLPSWAVCKGRSWSTTGLRLVIPLYGPDGTLESVHARTVSSGAADMPKGASPKGYDVGGLVMADALGQMILGSGTTPAWWDWGPLWVYICEGAPDHLTAAVSFPDYDERAPATFGVISGSWAESVARRIPDGSEVTVGTHTDSQGDKYAQQIYETHQRCRMLRLRGAA